MFPLEQYRPDAIALGREPFIERYGQYFFVHAEKGATAWGADMEWQTIVAPADAPAPTVANSGWAIPVRKRPGNPNPNQLSIGRARSNDIVIRYSFVSKLHAHVLAQDGSLSIRDLGSSNGTKVNGIQLTRMQAVPLTVGDQISFGQLNVRLTSAAAFQARLRAPEPPASSTAFSDEPALVDDFELTPRFSDGRPVREPLTPH